MLFIIGLNMVFEKRTETREGRAEELLEETLDPEDISVFPMGIPMIAGPGTMASLLILSSDAGDALPQQIAIMSALGLVLLITLISFLIAGPLMKLMGKTLTNVLTRVLGVLLATLAAQFILDGIKGGLVAQTDMISASSSDCSSVRPNFLISRLSRTVLRSASSEQATNLPSREASAIPQ